MTVSTHLANAARHALDHDRLVPCLDGPQDAWVCEDPWRRAVAAAFCTGCPVWDVCATAAEMNREPFGVWAGKDRTPTSAPPRVVLADLTPQQRAAHRRARRAERKQARRAQR